MAIRPIAQIGDPVLRQPVRELSKEELAGEGMQAFIDELVENMRHANGAGLSANQIHESVRICAIEVKDNPRYPYKPNVPLTVLVNPRLEPVGEERFDNFEGCLSVPNLRGVVSRHATIRVRAWDRHGNEIDEIISGVTAGTYQHEVDHLDGRIFVDLVRDPHSFCTWDEFKKHHEAEFAERVRGLVKRYGS